MTGPRNQILVGDATAVLSSLPEAFVDCVITSPPYYQLRNYGVEGQIGLEPSVDEWVARLVDVMREVGRVLKPWGAVWLNVGDSYSRHARYGAAPKGALLAPERLLLALAQDGWLVRNKVVWAKPNPLPSSVRDRLNTTHEFVYLLVRARQYWFDLDAIREPHRSRGARNARAGIQRPPDWAGPLANGTQNGLRRAWASGLPGHPLGKNPGDVWSIAPHASPDAHYATFPVRLVERPLLATCPVSVCAECGNPSLLERVVGATERTCRCGCEGGRVAGLVLDPFFGSGTVGVVATRHRRNWLGIELNPGYVRLAQSRIERARLERARVPLERKAA